MKKNVRNALAISGLAFAIGTSGFIIDASANTGGNSRIQRSHQERIVRTRRVVTEKTATGRHIVMGTVSAVTDSTISLTKGAKTYTINTASDTRLLNLSWKTIALTDIKVGNKIRVFGAITDATVSAKTVRDISLQ